MGILGSTKNGIESARNASKKAKDVVNSNRRNPKIGGKCAYDATGNGDGGMGDLKCTKKIRAGSMDTCGSAKCIKKAMARMEHMKEQG